MEIHFSGKCDVTRAKNFTALWNRPCARVPLRRFIHFFMAAWRAKFDAGMRRCPRFASPSGRPLRLPCSWLSEERAPPSDAFVMCVLPTFAALSDETLRRYTLGPLTFLTRERAAFPGWCQPKRPALCQPCGSERWSVKPSVL